MTDVQRHQNKPDRPKYLPVDSGTVVEIGDLIARDSGGSIVTAGHIYTASQQPWDTDLVTTQQNFKANFIGVAQSASADGETDPVRVRDRGVFKYPIVSSTMAFNAPVAPESNDPGGSPDGLQDQKLVEVTSTESIGRHIEDHSGSAVTNILAELRGTNVPTPA